MIYKALDILVSKMGEFLTNKFNLDEKICVLSSPSGTNEQGETAGLNKLLLTLINLERETVMGINFKSQSLGNSHISQGRPALSLNLYVLVSANFIDKNYPEALKYLSAALEFFQSNDLITKFNTPDLDNYIQKLHLEFVNLSFHELSNLWSILGSKYLPSFLMKVRMLTLDGSEVSSVGIVTENVKTTI
jgi:hypothetical protein